MLLVLIPTELKPVSPTPLIPFGFDQVPTPEAVADTEAGRIAGEQPPRLGAPGPHPGWPKDRGQQRLSVSWRNVDDQITDAACGDGLQMFADGPHMHAIHKRRVWFQDVPCLADELIQASVRLLRLQFPEG